jgi:uncharacterized membrane protein YjjB (DUF3815 family)
MQAETRARDSWKEITDLALDFGRLSMEAGASARHVEDMAERVALGLAASAALALALRTIALGAGWRLEAASFVAAFLLGIVVQLLPSWIGVSRNALPVVGCIPLIPGGFTAKAILGLFAVTAQRPDTANEVLIAALENLLRALFTIGALGTGLALPIVVLRARSRRISRT